MKINRKYWIWRTLNIFGDLGKNSLSRIEKAVLSSFPLAEGRFHDPFMKSLVNFYLLEYREIYQFPSTVKQTENGYILWYRINQFWVSSVSLKKKKTSRVLIFYLTINFEIMGLMKGPRGKDVGNPFVLLMRKQEAWKSRMIEAG